MKQEILSRISGGSKQMFSATASEAVDIAGIVGDLAGDLAGDVWNLVKKVFFFVAALIAFPFAIAAVPLFYVLIPSCRTKCKRDLATKLAQKATQTA